MPVREDMELHIEHTRALAEIVRLLAEAELGGLRTSPPRLYKFLAEELDAQCEQMQVEVEDWPKSIPRPAPAPIEPPRMPPLTEQEIEAEADITRRLEAAIPLLRQRNLDRAVLLARQAAEGNGPLVDHFADLGRRFGAEQAEGGAQ